MTICTACLSKHRVAVDDALMLGVSVRDVASQFQLTKSAVARHRAGCLQPKVAAAARLVAPATEVRRDIIRAKAVASGEVTANHDDILSLTALMGRLARSLERLEVAADSAAGSDLHQSLAALSGQLHRGIESAAKIQGLYAEPAAADGPPRFSLTITMPSAAVSTGGLVNVTPSPARAAGPEPFNMVLNFPGAPLCPEVAEMNGSRVPS